MHTSSLIVHTAINGKKAARYLEELADTALPCLIIVDYNLPEVDGAQLLEILSLNERFKTIPIVVWSTSNSPHYKQICLSRGARAIFCKTQRHYGHSQSSKGNAGLLRNVTLQMSKL